MVQDRALGIPTNAGRTAFLACPLPGQRRALDDKFLATVEHLFDTGWTPHDVFEAIRRNSSAQALPHLLDVAATATASHPAHLVHHRWQAQLKELGATARQPDRARAEAWVQRSGLDWPAAVEQFLDILGVADRLSVVEPVLPRPGSPAAALDSGDGINTKVLRRVRALLAKAESTEHEEEAEALTAKAQALMTQHSLERVLCDLQRPIRQRPVVRRLWLDNPYLRAKSLLVSAVATANHCRTVFSPAWGFVTVIGHEIDLEVVEVLTTSLLVQSTRAMISVGPQTSRAGVSRTRSFRHSFLIAYAGRIGERLSESADVTESAVDADRGGALLPVLAARTREVEELKVAIFPRLSRLDVRVSNGAGWGAGRAAADLARLDVRRAVRGRERSV